MFLENSHNSQENTCVRASFFNKVAGWGMQLYLLKKRLSHRCFLVNFAKFLRTPFLQNISGRLLLKVKNCNNWNTCKGLHFLVKKLTLLQVLLENFAKLRLVSQLVQLVLPILEEGIIISFHWKKKTSEKPTENRFIH